jgi:hypothetical protein
MRAGMGPKTKKARAVKTSAGSNFKNGRIGKTGWIPALTTVVTAVKLPRTAAPVKLTLLLAKRPSPKTDHESCPNPITDT